MLATKTDEALRKAEALHAHSDPERADLIARARRFKSSWFELGEALVEVRHTERYKQWGHPSFEDYCRRELQLRRETAEKLTGSFAFLRRSAPEVLLRDGREAPIPSYQAVDFLRSAEESEAPEEAVREIRRQVLDEGASLPRLSRLYRQVIFPVDEAEASDRRRAELRRTVDRLVEQLALAKDEGLLPATLCAEVEEPLSRLSSSLSI